MTPHIKKKSVENKIGRFVDIALGTQTACNLAGVSHSFSMAMKLLGEYDRAYVKKGTAWRNEHPITIILTQTLTNITGLGILNDEPYVDAMEWCLEWQKGRVSNPDYTKHSIYTERLKSDQ